MQGHVKIDVMNNTGAVLQTYEKDNTILSPLTSLFDKLISFYNCAGGVGQDALQALVPNFYGTNYMLTPAMFGLNLYTTTKDVASGGATSSEFPLAKAGGVLATPTATVGTFAGSSDLLNASGGKVGLRMMWDFPTITGNGTINSVALTTREFSENNISRALTVASGLGAQWEAGHNYNAGYTGSLTDMKKIFSFDAKGNLVKAEGGSFSKSRKQLRLCDLAGPQYGYKNEYVMAAAGFSNIFKLIDDDAANIYVVFGTGPDGNKAVAYVDKTTLVTTQLQSISCANALTVYDFGICGRFIVLLNVTYTTGLITLYIVDPTTNTYVSINPPNHQATNVNYHNRQLLTYKGVDGDYCCDLAYYYWSSSNGSYNATRFVELFANTTTVVFNDQAINSNALGYSSPSIPYMNFGADPLCLLLAHPHYSTNYYNYGALAFARRTLFGICNLETPIVKTSANIIRVTYDLTWA